jgi:hypothetical protein
MGILTTSGARAAAGACLLVLLGPLAAAAQGGAPPSTPISQGPMTVEREKSGFLVAPDFKVTEFDHQVSQLLGGYAGWLGDRKLLLGGGGYWLVNGSHDREMVYGGAVVGWLVGGDRRIGFGAKGLIGGGRATLVSSINTLFDDHGRSLQVSVPGGVTVGGITTTTAAGTTSLVFPSIPPVNVRFHDDFFIAEPEATVTVRLTRHFRVNGGAGYRLIGGARGTRDRLQGATGSLALQIGGG